MVTKQVGEYHTIQGAAERLGVSYWSLYGYVRRNRVPSIRVGKAILVRLQDLRGIAQQH
jgi:excisionase family DNA binding protein